MKKLLKVSLMAMLVATPMIASAATVPVAYVDGATVGQNGQLSAVTASADVASTSYVKGAYNELAQAINTVNSNALTLSTAETGTFTADSANTQTGDVLAGLGGTPTISEAVNLVAGQVDANTADIATKADANDVYTKTEVDTKISGLDGTTSNTSLSESNGVLTVEVDGTHVTRDSTTGALTLSTADANAIADVANKANSSFVGTLPQNAQATTVVGYIDEAVAAAGGQTAQQVEDAIDAAAGAGLATDTHGVLSVDVDGSTIEVDGTSGKVQVKDGSIDTAKLDAGVVTSLGKADSAVQSITTGSANGTISVDGTDVTVKNGLTTSSYVTVHTTWGNDATTDTAQVLTNTAQGS